jgi:hypothetical protein
LNSNETDIIVPSLISNPDDFHCSSINLTIKSELLLLLTKNGSDNLNLGFEGDFDDPKNGIIK